MLYREDMERLNAKFTWLSTLSHSFFSYQNNLIVSSSSIFSSGREWSKFIPKIHGYRLFTFFYIHKKKVLDSKNFRHSFFDGFTCFEMSWTRFDHFLKISVCLHVCLQNFVDTVSQELMRGNWWNFIFSCILI